MTYFPATVRRFSEPSRVRSSSHHEGEFRGALRNAMASGMLVFGFFNLYLLKLIGVTTAPGWDVAATGIIPSDPRQFFLEASRKNTRTTRCAAGGC